MEKWVAAKAATCSCCQAAWAAEHWATTCDVMRAMSDDLEGVCATLDRHLLAMQQQQQQTAKRKRTKQLQPQCTVTAVSASTNCQESAAVSAQPQPIAAVFPGVPPEIGLEPTLGLQEVSAVTAQPQQPAAGPPAGPETTGPEQCSSASGLHGARNKRGRRPVQGYTDRRDRFQQHLIDQTSSGKPVRVRDLYQTFRCMRGIDGEPENSTKLRTVLLDICGRAESVDYFLYSKQPPPATICPSRKPEDTQKLAGMATVLGTVLYMYNRQIPRNYPKGPRKCAKRDVGNILDSSKMGGPGDGGTDGDESGNQSDADDGPACMDETDGAAEVSRGSPHQDLSCDQSSNAVQAHEIFNTSNQGADRGVAAGAEGELGNRSGWWTTNSDAYHLSENSNGSSDFRSFFTTGTYVAGVAVVEKCPSGNTLHGNSDTESRCSKMELTSLMNEDNTDPSLLSMLVDPPRQESAAATGATAAEAVVGWADGTAMPCDPASPGPAEVLFASTAGSIGGGLDALCSDVSDSSMRSSYRQDNGQNLEILAKAAAVAHGSNCWMCLDEPTDGCRACPECSKSVCLTCASISNGLLDAVRPFLNPAKASSIARRRSRAV